MYVLLLSVAAQSAVSEVYLKLKSHIGFLKFPSCQLWTLCFILVCCALQHCKIYLCGTKSDLIQEDRSLRKIDYHDAQDFAEGEPSGV